MKIIGHQKILSQLSEMILQDRLPHALLLTGPPGIGKKLVALHLAQILFCQGQNKPCENCPPCRKVGAYGHTPLQGHPDLHFLEPEDDLIKIDKIRELKESLSLKPYEAPFKIALLVDADAMNISAANALLKTLEEPPPNTFLILTSSNPHRFLRTILSRCQKIQLQPLRDDEVQKVLEQMGGEKTKAKQPHGGVSAEGGPASGGEGATRAPMIDPALIHYASGSPGLALSFSKEAFSWVKETLLPALESQPKDMLGLFSAAEEISQDEKVHHPLLQLLMMEWREKILADPTETQFKKFDAIQKAARALDHYANPLLTFETLFLNLCL